MARKGKRPARKRKPKAAAKVVDIGVKRAEKIDGELRSLGRAITKGLDDQVALIVDSYHAWEQAHPDLALTPSHKIEMVRYGFVGRAGFERCHEPDRLPEEAFILEDGDIDRRIWRDHDASEVLMCPAMEAGVCEGAWRGMGTPPCHLLLLEIHRGLGGGTRDEAVEQVVDDFRIRGGPEECAESFARGARVAAKHKERGSSS